MYELSNTFETGISDHDKLISTAAKSGSFKGRPREKIYRSYRSFNIETFKKTLSDKLSRLESNSYIEFEKAFLTVLNKQALLKAKFLRHNNNPFMTKELRKAIMKRSQLKNTYNKNHNYENWYLYKKQRNFCVSLLRKTKRNYFKNVKIQDITDNKKFWKTIRPYFSDKGYNQTKITIVEKDSIITDEKKIATLMNNYFINITKNLDLKPSTVPNTSDLDEITKHFDDHISICKIKEAYSEILRENNFSFKMVSMDKVKKVVLKLNSKKSCHPCKYPKTNYRDSLALSDKPYQSFF